LDEPASVDRLWQEFKLKASADARVLGVTESRVCQMHTKAVL
jgi:DNA-directed RNA polymerase specialized sigma subunit